MQVELIEISFVFVILYILARKLEYAYFSSLQDVVINEDEKPKIDDDFDTIITSSIKKTQLSSYKLTLSSVYRNKDLKSGKRYSQLVDKCLDSNIGIFFISRQFSTSRQKGNTKILVVKYKPCTNAANITDNLRMLSHAGYSKVILNVPTCTNLEDLTASSCNCSTFRVSCVSRISDTRVKFYFK